MLETLSAYGDIDHVAQIFGAVEVGGAQERGGDDIALDERRDPFAIAVEVVVAVCD